MIKNNYDYDLVEYKNATTKNKLCNLDIKTFLEKAKFIYDINYNY